MTNYERAKNMSNSISAIEMATILEATMERCKEVIYPEFGDTGLAVASLAIAITASEFTKTLIGESEAEALASEATEFMGIDPKRVEEIREMLKDLDN